MSTSYTQKPTKGKLHEQNSKGVTFITALFNVPSYMHEHRMYLFICLLAATAKQKMAENGQLATRD